MKRSFDIAVLATVLALFVLLNVLLFGRAAEVARRTEVVPVPSTYRTTASGTKALYTLLPRLGVTVGRIETPLVPVPDRIRVIVMLEPQILVTRFEALALREWVDRGGTLVLATEAALGPASPVRELPENLFLRDAPAAARRLASARRVVAAEPYRRGELLRWEAQRPNRYLAGVRALELDLDASRVPAHEVLATALPALSDGRQEWPVAGLAAAPLCSLMVVGRGRIFLLPTPALFANAQLGRADNAVFAANLIASHAAGGPVMFDEYHLGNIGADSFWAALWRPPARWVTLQVLAALLLLAVRAAVRFGPARPDEEEPPRRPAVEFALSLAGLYRRAGARGEVARLWGEATRRELERAVGLPAGAPLERVAARVAQRTGRAEAEVREVLDALAEGAPQATDRRLVTLARRADSLIRAARRGPGKGPDAQAPS